MPAKNTVTSLSLIEKLMSSGRFLKHNPVALAHLNESLHKTDDSRSSSGMINLNYGKIILRLECLIYEWVRRQIVPQLAFLKGRV